MEKEDAVVAKKHGAQQGRSVQLEGRFCCPSVVLRNADRAETRRGEDKIISCISAELSRTHKEFHFFRANGWHSRHAGFFSSFWSAERGRTSGEMTVRKVKFEALLFS